MKTLKLSKNWKQQDGKMKKENEEDLFITLGISDEKGKKIQNNN